MKKFKVALSIMAATASLGTAAALAAPAEAATHSSAKVAREGHGTAIAPGARDLKDNKGTTLDVGQDLQQGDYLTSPNGQYKFVFQEDGNLVLYGPKSVIWVMPARVIGAQRLEFRADNNLYIQGAKAYEWSSKTSKFATAETGNLQLSISDNGRAQLRGTKGEHKLIWDNGFVLRGTALRKGQELERDQAITSPDGRITLGFQSEVGGQWMPMASRMVLRNDFGKVLWQSEHLANATRVQMTDKGDLVALNPDSSIAFTSYTAKYATEASGELFATVSDRGELQIRTTKTDRSIWENGVVYTGYVLNGNDKLERNECIESTNHIYRLTFQADSNLVLTGPGRVIWNSGVKGGAERAFMGPDGNLTMREDGPGGKALWSSLTGSFTSDATGPLRTVVTEQGKVRIQSSKRINGEYKVFWENGEIPSVDKGTTLSEGGVLQINEFLSSPNKKYRLVSQGDSSVVLYGPNGPIWVAKTSGANRAQLLEGSLVLRDGDKPATWSTNTGKLQTEQTGPLELTVTDTGFVQLIGSHDKSIVWQNGNRYYRELNVGDWMVGNDVLSSPNNQFQLTIIRPPSGKSVLAVTDSKGQELWRSGEGLFALRALMGTDNNLVLGQPAKWSSQTSALATEDTGNLQVVLTDAGVLQIRGTKGEHKVVWQDGKAV